jgi:hypothetical protein
MTDTQGGEAAAVETTTTAAAQAALSSQERNWEAEAKELGWVPQDQFKGDADKWRPAEEFVRRGEEILPIVRKQNESLKNETKELRETIDRMSRMFEKTTARIKADYEGKIEALKAERREAIKAGDADKVDRIDASIDTLKTEIKDEPAATVVPEAGSKEHKALVKDFAAANAWFLEEPDMASYAEQFSQRNAELNEGISFQDNMKATVAAVRKKFPAYFGNATAANGHAAVDAGGSFPGAQPTVDPKVAKLPREARDQMAKDIKAGLYKTEKAWAEAYFS